MSDRWLDSHRDRQALDDWITREPPDDDDPSWDDYMTRKHGHPEWASDPDDDDPENVDDAYRDAPDPADYDCIEDPDSEPFPQTESTDP